MNSEHFKLDWTERTLQSGNYFPNRFNSQSVLSGKNVLLLVFVHLIDCPYLCTNIFYEHSPVHKLGKVVQCVSFL